MSKNSFKIWFPITAFFLTVGFVLVWVALSDNGPDDKTNIEYLNDDVDFVCLIYGDDYDMNGLVTERVDNIETDTVLRDNDYVYLLMFDLSGGGNITKEDAYRLVNIANENSNFNFYYVGSKSMGFFQEARGANSIIQDNLVLGYCFERVSHFGSVGLWTKEDMSHPERKPEISIPKLIISDITRFVSENEKN